MLTWLDAPMLAWWLTAPLGSGGCLDLLAKTLLLGGGGGGRPGKKSSPYKPSSSSSLPGGGGGTSFRRGDM